jgi:CDP-4-dehydro-6-deoxyglucose reductase
VAAHRRLAGQQAQPACLNNLRVTLKNSLHSFEVRADQTLLEAALGAGLNLPHSCKGGNCGACKARLISGEIDYAQAAPLGLSSSETAEGLILLCQARARGDVTLETFEVRPAADAGIKRLPCRIERAIAVSHDVMQLFLKLPAAEEFQFAPGQYLDIMLPGGRRRSFSIASPPHDAKPLELHVRRVVGGEFTDKLFHADTRQALLSIEGPLGQFVYRESAAPMLLLGGGTGLAPLLSILRHVIDNHIERDLHLYWGVRSERDLYALQTLEDLRSKAPGLRFTPVLSEAAADWRGRTGWVHEAPVQDIADLSAFEIYMAGPPAMISAARHAFAAQGVAPEKIYFDSFDYAPDALERQRSSAASKS